MSVIPIGVEPIDRARQKDYRTLEKSAGILASCPS